MVRSSAAFGGPARPPSSSAPLQRDVSMPVDMIDIKAIRERWHAVGSKLDERGRRLFAAGEVSHGWTRWQGGRGQDHRTGALDQL